ncbi:MAG: HAMP domain-containing histidine kinase [Dehalococcoidia bacterium]|nr:HAMP domain-containing histidine kinase [Dehalococcoidia bacterium]
MRYQIAALLTGVITVLALGAAAAFVWVSVGEDDDQRRQVAAEAELAAVQAALNTRIDILRGQAAALLQQDGVTTYAVREDDRPDVLELGGVTRGGGDYILVSGPGRRLVWQDGLTGSIVNGVGDVTDAAIYLLDGATEGGIFDFVDGPVLAGGASTGPGTERAAIALGVLLDQEALSSMVSDPSRQLTLAWATNDAPPDGVQILPGTAPGRISIVAPLDLGRAQRTLVAIVDAPADALPVPAGDGLSRWAGILTAIGLAGAAAFVLIVRTMASNIGDVRQGLLAAQERDGSPAVLDTLAGRDEVGRTAQQAADTLRSVRERTLLAVDEARVATARQLLGEHVIRSMQEGVLVERSDTTCIVCNPAASDLITVEPGDVVGRRGALHDVLGVELYQRMHERAKARDAAQRLDVVQIGGRDLAFDAYRVPEYRGDGHSLLIIVRDVSAVLEVEQLKRDVVSVVSHELRTPLTVVALSLGMMTEPNTDQGQLLDAAERNVQRMRELVDDMLDLARLESGQTELSLEPYNPVQICREVCDFLRPQAHDKQVDLRDAVDGVIPQVIEADGRQLQRAITNLVTNAIKFSPPGSTVWVVLRDGGDHLFIDVADAGPGVPAEEHDRIFTRFYRASNTRDQISGTGLGLPIVRQIAELHGGTADLLPTEQGAYFRISLPVGERATS